MAESDFPDVNTGAISTLASDLELIAYALVDVGLGSENLRDAVVQHEHKAVTDRRWLTRYTLWHWAGIARFVRKHPERLRAL